MGLLVAVCGDLRRELVDRTAPEGIVGAGWLHVAELLVEPLLLLGGQSDRVGDPGASVCHAFLGL